MNLNDIGDHMRSFAIENHIISKTRRMLISSMKLSQGPLTTPVLRFYLEQGLELTRIFFFIQYTAENSFVSFVDKVVQSRREGDGNRQTTVVAETMKLIGNRAYGYQIRDPTRHTKTKYVLEPMIEKLINNKLFVKHHEQPGNIYEVEPNKNRVVHKEPIIIGFSSYNTQNLSGYSSSTIFVTLSTISLKLTPIVYM